MVRLSFKDPVLFHHRVEQVTAENDLNLIEAIRRYGHADHVTERVSKWTFLHLHVQSVSHLDQCLDCDRLQSKLHDHYIVHERMERYR